MEDLQAENIATTAVHADRCYATLENPTIRYCGIGCLASPTYTIAIAGGRIEYCGIGATASASSLPAQVVANGVTFAYCEIGIGASGHGYGHPGIVTAAECTFGRCGIGISSCEGSGSIKGCTFDVDDTGISITNSISTLYTGGAGYDHNESVRSLGDGIHLGSWAKATVGANTFQNVAGTAIHVESGNGDVSISGCEIAGSGGFQGIRTRGAVTTAHAETIVLQPSATDDIAGEADGGTDALLLMRFDLEGIPAGARIQYAGLRSYDDSGAPRDAPFVPVGALRGDWEASDDASADLAALADARFSTARVLVRAAKKALPLNVTPIVEAWAGGSLPNHGFVTMMEEVADLQDVAPHFNAETLKPTLQIRFLLPQTDQR